ncbi:hypothetical protein V5799_005967 [Amblyomma americanum]|uniref:Uncharacterized protein n=1 Tax=Amblyomma americanum TaxID=6943 RepID=A0AAQ4DXQ7_AMBAM
MTAEMELCTKKIKDLCKAVRNTEDPNLRRQVKLLHDWIDPEDMSLRGGDFFEVNLSLLIQMAASVITFSVILVQTDQSIGSSHKKTSRGFFSVSA